MGTTAEKLNRLIQTKAEIKQAIKDKGVEVQDTDTFASYADKITSIQSGGSTASYPEGTKFAYSTWTEIDNSLKTYIENQSDLSSMFYQCYNIKSLPVLNTSKCTDMGNTFYYCTAITSIGGLNTSKCTNMVNTFNNCLNLTSIPEIDTSKVTNLTNCFYFCAKIKSIPVLNTSLCTIMNYMFSYCTSLIRIKEIDVINCINPSSIIYFNNNTIRYFLVKNIGASQYATSITTFSPLNVYGIENSDELSLGARQSLIDTLITYSYDRVTAGFSSATIKLSTSTKALLTDEEIAAITAKGFTIA